MDQMSNNMNWHTYRSEAGVDTAYVPRARRALIMPSPGGVSKFDTDYMFMGEDRTPITIRDGYDGLTKALFANVVPCKGMSHGCAETALATNVLCTGQQKVIQQSDQEPSIIDVNHKAGTHIPNEIVYEESPVGDSNSNGSLRNAARTLTTLHVGGVCEMQLGH